MRVWLMLTTMALVVAAVAAVVALGGLVAAVYSGVRLLEWWRERGPVSVELLSHGAARCVHRDKRMFHVRVRLHNPKAVPCRVSRACLSHQGGGYILGPVREAGCGEYWYKGDMPIELPPKQHLELELGFLFDRAAFSGETAWEEFELDLDLDDGSHACSKPFKHPIDLRKAR